MAASTNETVVSFAVEESPGKLPVSPIWKSTEVNDISALGATITTSPRNPISESRGAKKGSVTDLDSSVELPMDLTMESFLDFSQGFMYAQWYKQKHFKPTAVTGTGYTVDALGDLTEDTLVYARGFLNSGNNGLKVVGALSTSTDIVVSGLIVEGTVPEDAELDVAGVQGGTGDLEIDALGNLTSTTLNFTTLGLTVGQSIWVGGATTDTSFDIAEDIGYARLRLIESNKLTLDNKLQAFAADSGTGKTIQIFIGSFIRDVPTKHEKFIKETYTFEAAYSGLGVGEDENEYEYPKGNYTNSFTFSWPGQALATMTTTFVGLDTPDSVQVQATGERVSPSKTSGFNTTSDFTRLRLTKYDETGITTYFDTLDLTINNNVNPRKIIGTLGAAFINVGGLEVTGSTTVIFTDTAVIKAVRNNETCSLDFAIDNDDGSLHYNIPSMTLGGADKSYPRNESITMNITSNAFEDTFFGYSVGITHYPYLPIGE